MFEDENYFSESEYYPHLSKIYTAINTMVARLEGDYDFIPLRKDPLMAWVPVNHLRVRDGVYPLRDFETEAYIDTYPGQETDNNLAFRANGLTPHGQFLSVDVI